MKKLIKLLLFVPVICVPSCRPSTNTNVKLYESLLNDLRDNADAHSELYIFPNTINQENTKQFKYMHTEDLFNGAYLFYLVQQYEVEDYQSELNRLSQIKAVFTKYSVTKNIIHLSEKNMYLTVYRNHNYEYAIYNEETCTISYVFNQLYDWETVKIDCPINNVDIPDEVDDGGNSYNIYYYYEKDVGYYIED